VGNGVFDGLGDAVGKVAMVDVRTWPVPRGCTARDNDVSAHMRHEI